MYSTTRVIVIGLAAASAAVMADLVYSAGRAEGRVLFITSEPEPSPGEVELSDDPNLTESDEG